MPDPYEYVSIYRTDRQGEEGAITAAARLSYHNSRVYELWQYLQPVDDNGRILVLPAGERPDPGGRRIGTVQFQPDSERPKLGPRPGEAVKAKKKPVPKAVQPDKTDPWG